MSSQTGAGGDEPPGEMTVEAQSHRSVGEIAHDLSNVLTSVLGYAEIVAEDARSGIVNARDADQLLAATRQAVALVKVLRASGRATPPVPDAETSERAQPERS